MSMDSQLEVACSGNRSPKAAVDNKHTHGTKDINILILGKRDVGKTGGEMFVVDYDIICVNGSQCPFYVNSSQCPFCVNSSKT